MNIKKLALSLFTACVLAASPMSAFALSNYTLNGNYVITGDLYVDSLLGHVGQCLEVGTGPLGASEIVATGSPCGGGGGGGVTSVTAGPSGNITAAPTTGAVIVDEIEDPTFTGLVSVGNPGVGSNTSGFAIGSSDGAGETYLTACTGPCNVLNGISATALNLSNNSGSYFTVDGSGNFSILDNFYASGLATSVGQGLAIGTNGEIVPSGTASVQTQHGNQSITAVAAACTPGTPIVFAHTFSAVPDIIMSTSAVVGDTAAPETGTITTTGFTPELCSVASASAATVYWQAVN